MIHTLSKVSTSENLLTMETTCKSQLTEKKGSGSGSGSGCVRESYVDQPHEAEWGHFVDLDMMAAYARIRQKVRLVVDGNMPRYLQTISEIDVESNECIVSDLRDVGTCVSILDIARKMYMSGIVRTLVDLCTTKNPRSRTHSKRRGVFAYMLLCTITCTVGGYGAVYTMAYNNSQG